MRKKYLIYFLIAYGSFLSEDLILFEAPAMPKNFDPTVTLVLPSILEKKRLYPRAKLDTFKIIFSKVPVRMCTGNIYSLYKNALQRNMELAYLWIHQIFYKGRNAIRDSTK
jgi:hypothetical protein